MRFLNQTPPACESPKPTGKGEKNHNDREPHKGPIRIYEPLHTREDKKGHEPHAQEARATSG